MNLPTSFARAIACGSVAAALACVQACASPPADEVAQSTDSLSTASRVARYERIRDVLATRGITTTGYLFGGIAYDETGLAHCWSEATWACKGPASPDCGGGPVIAGAWDGPCDAQKGGLGMFQFDAGRFSDTLRVYGQSVLTIEGQVHRAVDFVVRIVRDSPYTPNAENDAKALAWIQSFDSNDRVRRDQWIKTVVRFYNGCPEGADCWPGRYRTYSEGLSQVLADTGGTSFWRARGRCPGASGTTGGAIEAKFAALGGCNSILGAPITSELMTPDGRGRYNVFQKGSIYWTAETGAHEVHGRIRDAYRDAGWEAGALGYPTSDEYDVAGGKQSEFQHGRIRWVAATNTTEVLRDGE